MPPGTDLGGLFFAPRGWLAATGEVTQSPENTTFALEAPWRR